MKRIFTITATVMMATTPIMGLVNNNTATTVQAAKKSAWHKGMPKKLRGNWKGHGMVLKVSNKAVYFVPAKGAAVSKAKRVIYRQTKKNSYQYKVYWKNGGTYKATIKYISKHKVKFQGYTLKK